MLAQHRKVEMSPAGEIWENPKTKARQGHQEDRSNFWEPHKPSGRTLSSCSTVEQGLSLEKFARGKDEFHPCEL